MWTIRSAARKCTLPGKLSACAYLRITNHSSSPPWRRSSRRSATRPPTTCHPARHFKWDVRPSRWSDRSNFDTVRYRDAGASENQLKDLKAAPKSIHLSRAQPLKPLLLRSLKSGGHCAQTQRLRFQSKSGANGATSLLMMRKLVCVS